MLGLPTPLFGWQSAAAIDIQQKNSPIVHVNRNMAHLLIVLRPSLAEPTTLAVIATNDYSGPL